MKYDNQYPTQYDKMTEMPVSRLILMLGFPSTISLLITHIYNLVDTYFVGQLGTSASGAVGIVFGIMAILQAFGFMYGQGSGVVVSRLLGSKKEEEASKVASTALFGAFITGIAISAIGLSFLEPILYCLGSTETIIPFAKKYAIWIFLAAPFIMCSLVLNNLFRFQGKANLGMLGISLGAVINMFLDPILMFHCNLGITGAGISTAFSQLLGFVVLISIFQSGRSQYNFQTKYIRCFSEQIKRISITGLPALLRQGLGSISTMMMNREARIFGDSAVAAMSIVGRISFFIFAVGLGVAQGYQPVAGFNYGAKKFERVRKGFLFTILAGEIILGIFAIAGLIAPIQVVNFFRNDVEVRYIGGHALFAQCIGVFFLPLTVCSNVLFQSAGRNKEAVLISGMRSGLIYIPLILILSDHWGIRGIELAQPVADILAFMCTLPIVIKFYRQMDTQ